MSEKKQNSKPGIMFTRIIQRPDGCLQNFVGRDSGLGSTFGTISAGPSSISSLEEPTGLQLQAEPLSVVESTEGAESGSGCGSVTSQETVRAVQPAATMPPAQIPVTQLPSTTYEMLTSNSSQLESAMKQSLVKQFPCESNQFSAKNEDIGCRSAMSLPNIGQNFLSDNEILYMADSRVPPFKSSCSSPVWHSKQQVSGSEDSGSSNLNSFSGAVSDILDYNVTAEPSDCDLDDIIIDPCEYKEEFKEKQYDIVLIYSENDRDQALTFRDILTRFITMEDNRHPSICVLDQNAHLTYINSRFTHMEEALKRSTFMFLFITKDFCGDSWAQLQRDECLMESIENPHKKWCVVPILTKPRKEADYTLPFGLRALKGVEINQMLGGKALKSVNASALQEGDVDQYFCNNMRKMLSTRIALKRQREKQQLIAFQRWLKEEKQRRWKEKQEEQMKNYLYEKERATERIKLQENLAARMKQELPKIEVEANKAAEAEADAIMKSMRMKQNTNFGASNIETKSLYEKPVKETGAVHHHHHYYGQVTQTSDQHTVYNIKGPVSESTFGNENKLFKEHKESGRPVLEQTNLETDSPADDIEYVIEVEPDSRFTSPGIDEEISADCMDRQEAVGERISTLNQGSSSPEASYSANLTFQKKNEANAGECSLTEATKCTPEIDNPHSPRFESAKRITQPEFHFTPENLSFLGTNMLDAGASSSKSIGTSRSFSNEPLTDRPVAAVFPIRQTSETFEKTDAAETMVKLPFNQEDDRETAVKSRFGNEEKSPKVKSPCNEDRNDDETALKLRHGVEDKKIKQMSSTNIMDISEKQETSCLPTTSTETFEKTFVVVEKDELPGSFNASRNPLDSGKKKSVQTDGGLVKVKPMMTGNRVPKCHGDSPSITSPSSAHVVAESSEPKFMGENLFESDKSFGNEISVGETCSNTSTIGLSNSSSTSVASPSPTKKCVIS